MLRKQIKTHQSGGQKEHILGMDAFVLAMHTQLRYKINECGEKVNTHQTAKYDVNAHQASEYKVNTSGIQV